MSDLLQQLQAVLFQIVAALEAEESEDVPASLECYLQACSVLSCALDSLELSPEDDGLDQQTRDIFSETFRGFLQTYDLRIKDLQASASGAGQLEQPIPNLQVQPCGQQHGLAAMQPPAAMSQHQVQLPAHRQSGASTGAMDSDSSSMTAAAGTGHSAGQLKPPKFGSGRQMVTDPMQHLAGLGPEDDWDPVQDGASGPDPAADAVLDVLRSCQKHVEGSLEDIAGLESVKLEIRQAVYLPMRFPHLFRGIRKPPKNFLMYGPPGTGKTMIVEKVAAEGQLTLISLAPSSLLSKWSGDSERTLRAAFDAAKAMQPSIIFMDEIDSLAPQRSGGDDLISRRLLTELLIQMNNAADSGDAVYIFAATNRLQDCDTAVLRRFDRRIMVPLPDHLARQAFFAKMLARPEIEHSLGADDVRLLVERTEGYSGSDVATVCKEAAMEPVKDLMSNPGLLWTFSAASAAPTSLITEAAGYGVLTATPPPHVPRAKSQQGSTCGLRYIPPDARHCPLTMAHHHCTPLSMAVVDGHVADIMDLEENDLAWELGSAGQQQQGQGQQQQQQQTPQQPSFLNAFTPSSSVPGPTRAAASDLAAAVPTAKVAADMAGGHCLAAGQCAAAEPKLRRVTLQDFLSALDRIKPAAQDQKACVQECGI